jgi:hypothetical protein
VGPAICHKYVMEQLGGQHALSMTITRYKKFIQSLKKFPKIAVQFLVEKVLRNCNTLTGQNVRFVLDKTGTEDIFKVNVTKVRNDLEFCKTKQEDEWRLNFVKEIGNIKNNDINLDQIENNLTTEILKNLRKILEYICTS